jgi:hypothetical protein
MRPPPLRYRRPRNRPIPRWVATSIAWRWRRWRWSVTKDLVVAIAEGVAIVPNERGRHRRVAEARVAVHVGGRTASDVTLCGFGAIMETLLRNFGAGRRRWRWIVRRRLGMRASGQCNRERKGCHEQQLLHQGFPLVLLLRRKPLLVKKCCVPGEKTSPRVVTSVSRSLSNQTG